MSKRNTQNPKIRIIQANNFITSSLFGKSDVTDLSIVSLESEKKILHSFIWKMLFSKNINGSMAESFLKMHFLVTLGISPFLEIPSKKHWCRDSYMRRNLIILMIFYHINLYIRLKLIFNNVSHINKNKGNKTKKNNNFVVKLRICTYRVQNFLSNGVDLFNNSVLANHNYIHKTALIHSCKWDNCSFDFVL